MDRIENKFGKTSVLTGQSAVTLLESKVSEGFQSPGIIATENSRNFFERTVHRKESTDLSFISGLAATGLRVGAFLEGSDLVSNYHQLVSSVRQHLPWVIHVSTQSRKQPMISNQPDHSNYHAVANTGCFQFFATNVQEVVDLGFISHKVAELSLISGINGMDSYSTSFSAQNVEVPGREAIEKFLGNPDDQINSPTPAQEMIFGNTRRRVPNWFNFDYPTLIGALKDGQTLGYEAVANLEFFYRHLSMLIGEVFSEYGGITGRNYQPVGSYQAEDAKYLVVTQGAAFNQIAKIVDYLRSKKEKVGCLNLRLYRPFPLKELTQWVSGKKGVTILERVSQPLASEAPIFSELVAAFHGRGDSFPSNLFSGIYGIGGLGLTDEEIIGTFENMIRGKEAKKKFYLGVSYSKKSSSFPKQQILLQNLSREYPELEKDSLEPVKFSGLPKSKIFSFYFSFLPGELNFQDQVEELLGLMQDLYDVRINGKFENRGYKVWMSQEVQSFLPDKEGTIDCIFASPGSLRSEKKLRGALTEKSRLVIISREKATDDLFPFPADIINEVKAKQVNVYHLAIDREQPIVQALQGALTNTLSDFLKDDRKEKILESIESYYQKNFLDLTEVRKLSIDAGLTNLENITGQLSPESEDSIKLDLPLEVRQSKDQGPPYFQLSHFYNNVGHFYEIGNKEELVADPFQAISAIPSATSNFLNLAGSRSIVPVFKPDNCTGCGECYVLCPHSAIPPIVIGVSSLIQGAMEIAATKGIEISKLTPVVKNLAKVASKIIKDSKNGIGQVSDFLPAAFTKLVEQMKLEGDKLNVLKTEFDRLIGIIGEFQVAATQPFFSGPEIMEKGSGELFSLGINPRACTGCGVCAIACNDGALEMRTQTPEIISQMESNFGLWEQLPDTPGETITRIHSNKEYDSFAAILLSRNFYQSMSGGYFSEAGAPAKTLMHLVTATTECVFQPRILNLAGEIKELIDSLSENIHSKLSEALPKEDFEGLSKVIGETHGQRVPIDEMVDKLRSKEHMKLVDVSSLQRKIDLLDALKHLNWILTEGPNGRGRSRFGVAVSDHDSLLWAKEYPYNFFYTPVLIQSDNITPDVAIGLFKGHLRHQLDNLKILRRARLEVKDKYEPGIHDEKIASLSWDELEDSERALIPPILLVGEINSWAERDLSKLNSIMSSDSLLKIIVIDNGLLPESNDPVDHLGKGINMLFAGLTTRNAFILQSSLGARSHMFNGLMEGIQTPGPALFYLYAPDQDQHSIYGNDWSKLSSQALKTRAFPLLKFNPNMGSGFISSSFDMESNPSADNDWTTIELKYTDGEQEKTLLYTLTYADWAFCQSNLIHHFKGYTEDEGNPIPVADFLALTEGAGENQVPVILMVDDEGILKKFSVSPHIIAACRAMLINWNTIREIGGILVPFPQKLRDQVEHEFNEKHEKEILQLKSEFQNKLKEQEKTQLEAVKKKLRDKLLALSSRAKFNQE